MTKATCGVDGCTRPMNSRGWCIAHYSRWKRSGDVGPAEVLPRGAQVGEKNSRWLGDNIAYAAVHRRLTVQQGRAKDHVCDCGAPARNWAYQHTADNERICEVRGLPFTTDLSHYKPMCLSCHNQLDALHGWVQPTEWGRGTSYHKKTNRWRAYATLDGKQRSGGYHRTREEAADAAAALRARLLSDLLERTRT